ncbi:polyketide synthase [Burkholderia sp. Ap-962]|uniref:type I polyketide synthase n=1 Tax=Burkholderia sp. Ap-962 TaxID=2608333 RepID=UPI001421A88F|nr:polyketide synthase [Burkholderia sp. Ap-962]NIF70268.1 polyketide synthase [Burkholderia sp. Ap-962]
MNGKIAIVGIACRFPGGVNNPEALWRLLRDERDAVTQIPAGRFGTEFHQHPSKREPGKSYTFAAGVLDDIAGFDAAFFGISPREAAQMDPQQRLLLELAWEAFEDAGLRPLDMRGRDCGVFVGVASPDYGNRSMDDLNSVDPYSATGNTLSIASNRVSYLFDLRGPSLSVDTACSSSLVALHQAVQALRSGETDMALAGGVNLLMHPFGFVSFSKASMLSPRGRCRAFDASGDGYVRAEGGAFVLLKPLERALADGDTIHAVIAGSGVNSDGYTQGGISVPGAATQAELLRSVYARAGVDPRAVSYLEAHGTGTAVGDPIEARALIEVMSAGRPADKPLLIGSIKTNIGHLETASGMAGLLKAVLCLKHRAVPRSLHFQTPNPAIDFAGGRLRVVERYTALDGEHEEHDEAPLTEQLLLQIADEGLHGHFKPFMRAFIRIMFGLFFTEDQNRRACECIDAGHNFAFLMSDGGGPSLAGWKTLARSDEQGIGLHVDKVWGIEAHRDCMAVIAARLPGVMFPAAYLVWPDEYRKLRRDTFGAPFLAGNLQLANVAGEVRVGAGDRLRIGGPTVFNKYLTVVRPYFVRALMAHVAWLEKTGRLALSPELRGVHHFIAEAARSQTEIAHYSFGKVQRVLAIKLLSNEFLCALVRGRAVASFDDQRDLLAFTKMEGSSYRCYHELRKSLRSEAGH